jgi:hypothetical protein
MASDVLDSDLALYFGFESVAPPKLVRMPVDGGAPFNINNLASFEASLDVQQVGGMVLGATIVLYNIPDLSDQSIFDAYQTITETNAVDIVNSSFGGPEGIFTADYNGGTDFTGIRQSDPAGGTRKELRSLQARVTRRTGSAFARIFHWTESGSCPVSNGLRRCRASLPSAERTW